MPLYANPREIAKWLNSGIGIGGGGFGNNLLLNPGFELIQESEFFMMSMGGSSSGDTDSLFSRAINFMTELFS